MKKSNKILMIMVVCAVVALGFGFYVMQSRTSPLPSNQQANTNADSEQNQNEEPVTPVTPTPPPVSTTDWKVYVNDKHSFNIKYPQSLKAGSISENSVLGTFQVPVRGYHVGPMVLVVLKDADIKKDAKELFDNVYAAAKNPPSGQGAEVPPVECKIILDTADKKAVACNGEGGPAKYGYITGPQYDVFMDGYSKGYGNADNGNISSDADYAAIISSFTFGTTSTSTPPPTASNPNPTTPNTSPNPTTPVIQTFSITADDSFASPTEITVAKNAIAQITFNVGTNTYYGGLDFKSSVVNSGTVNAGQSKTISFKATESFEFTPYWPASSVAKNYKIKVTVQ